MEQKPISNFTQKQDLLIKEIESSNFIQQNQELVNNGFTYLRKNLKMLRLFQGNTQKVLEAYKQQQAFKIERLNQKIIAFGLEEKNQKLIVQGYTNLHRNFRCLKKANFDLEKATEKLKYWDKQMESIPDLQNKVNELISKGYANKKFNEISLKKCGGNINDAIIWLEKKNKRFQFHRQAKNSGCHRQRVHDINFEEKILYLDGNLIFSEDKLNEVYQKINKQCAEKLLEEIAIRFAVAKTIKKLIIVFPGQNESTQKTIGKLQVEIIFTGKENSNACDYLIDRIKQLSNELESSIFIVTDRDTLDKMTISGAKQVMKSRFWMKLVKQQIVNQEFEKIIKSIK